MNIFYYTQILTFKILNTYVKAYSCSDYSFCLKKPNNITIFDIKCCFETNCNGFKSLTNNFTLIKNLKNNSTLIKLQKIFSILLILFSLLYT
jgi:hypothetical protein